MEKALKILLMDRCDYESAHQNYIHLLSLHKIIDDIFDEHEEIIKSERKKARSIVAMLFWESKRYARMGVILQSNTIYRQFKHAYKMLKDNA